MVAHAGTLTYIHLHMSKPMSTTVDRAIAIAQLRPGNRGGPRFNIFEIASRSENRAASSCPIFRSLAFTRAGCIRRAGRIIGPVARLLLCSNTRYLVYSNQIATIL